MPAGRSASINTTFPRSCIAISGALRAVPLSFDDRINPAPDALAQNGQRNRFIQIIRGVSLANLFERHTGMESGDDNRLNFRIECSDAVKYLESRHDRQRQVDNRNLG